MRTRPAAGHPPQVIRTYLVESNWPDVSLAAYHDGAARAAAAGREMRAAGRDLEFLGSTLVLVDEVVFWRFASGSLTWVEEASQRAGLTYDRILECVELSGSEPGAASTA